MSPASVCDVDDDRCVIARSGLVHVEPFLTVGERPSDSLGETGELQGEVDLEALVRLSSRTAVVEVGVFRLKSESPPLLGGLQYPVGDLLGNAIDSGLCQRGCFEPLIIDVHLFVALADDEDREGFMVTNGWLNGRRRRLTGPRRPFKTPGAPGACRNTGPLPHDAELT